jgi:hypothetical protein
MLDFRDLLTWEHDEWLQIQIEREMKEQEKLDYENGWDEEELKDENITDDDKYKSYINPDGDFNADDVPF